MAFPGEVQRDQLRPRHSSLIPTGQFANQEDYARIQDQLTQSLKREVDLHKKIKHLQEQLQLLEVRPRSPRQSRSMSDGSLSGTPDILWDSELSQTSAEGSPHLFQPALIVVSGSPRPPRKPASVSSEATQQQVNKSHPNHAVNGPSSVPDVRQGARKSLTLGPADRCEGPPSSVLDKGGLEQSRQLAPSPQDYRGIRQEREKPPPSLSSPVLQHSTSYPVDKDSSTFSFPTSHSPVSEVHDSKEENKFTSSVEGGQNNLFLSDNHTPPLTSGSASMPVKRRSKGYRGRSNTISLLPNWIRRKRGAAERPTSPPSSLRNNSPVESIADMFERFVRSASSSIQQDSLASYIDHHWSEVCQESECAADVSKYRDAVWDMFQSETKFLTRFLQPLEQVYKGFLEELHFHGVLKVADVDKIFANLSELCELSSSVARDLFKLFEGRSGDRIAPNKELILAFSMFGHKFNPVYQRFCINFEKQRGFVRALGQLPDFEEYMRVCRTHDTVGKNDFTALLIAPMNHQCHYQLLLEKVLKYTKDQSEKDLLSSAIKAFVVSLKELEAHIVENKRSDEMLELQETLCWPSLSQLDAGTYIPETLLLELSSQPCSSLLASKERRLLHRGTLKLVETKHAKDVEVFLFTDSLLLTQQSSAQVDKKTKKEPMNQLTRYHVLGHPVLLSMLDIHDIPPQDYHGHLITLVERNSFQQLVASYSLQAPTKLKKATWLSQLTQAKNLLCYRNSPNYTESDV